MYKSKKIATIIALYIQITLICYYVEYIVDIQTASYKSKVEKSRKF